MPFGDMLEDVGNFANQVPGLRQIVPGEYQPTPTTAADQAASTRSGEEWGEAGSAFLGALGAGAGAFGARIAGGEQGFVAYMNNMARQQEKEEDR